LELLSGDQPSLWVSTTDCSIRNWSIPSTATVSVSGDYDMDNVRPINVQPSMLIKGGASIRQYLILTDKRHIITKDSDENVAIWDVLMAKKVEDLQKCDYEEEIKRRSKRIFIPNWFTVDLKTGMLTVHLEETDCFAAWVSAREVGIGQSLDSSDPKLNLGCLVLQALLEHWPPTYVTTDDDIVQMKGQPDRRGGNTYFSMPDHTPVIFSEVGGRTQYRLLCKDAYGETEQAMLNETVPAWVVDVTVQRNLPRFNKISFTLQPYVSNINKPTSNVTQQLSMTKKDRLSASDMLQVRKVIEHVYEKVMGQGSDGGSQTAASTPATGSGQMDKSDTVTAAHKDDETSSSLIDEKVELLCNDQVLDPNMDLRTVKHFIWKQGGADLTLHYRLIGTK
jgi:WD repeat-containing protein 48